MSHETTSELLRFVARIGVGLWDWPCGHQPRPPESKDSRSASNAPRQQTQRRTGFLRGQSSFQEWPTPRGMARALASEALEAVGLRE